MHFGHSDEIWRDFPDLVPGVLLAEGVTDNVSVMSRTAKFSALAIKRLEAGAEGEMPEIQAWRRTFSKMGLKPTQYRCASESLLRRFRKERLLSPIHPLVDLCNSISLAFAIPVGVFDLSKIAEYMEVRYARGTEAYATLSGAVENPEPGEVIFADGKARAHARRWTNWQSSYSAVGSETNRVLIVAEAVHAFAEADIHKLITVVADELSAIWSIDPRSAILTRQSPSFEL